MIKPTYIQVPYDVFMDMVRVHIIGVDDPDAVKRIEDALNAKLDKLALRELYAIWHSDTVPPAEREQARLKYLQEVLD